MPPLPYSPRPPNRLNRRTLSNFLVTALSLAFSFMTGQKIVEDEIKKHEVEEWRPYPGAQALALAHPAREIFFGGARGPGKSWIQRLWLAKLAVMEARPGVLKYPTYKGAIFRFQAVDLRDWHSEAEKFFCGKLGAKPSGQPREYRFPGGPVIRSGHLENGGYINYVGWEIHKGGVDELTHLPTKHQSETGLPWCPDYQLLVNGSLRLSPDGNPQMFNTGNPGFSGDRWVKHRFIKITIGGKLIEPRTPFLDPISGHMRIFISATVFDNPWILKNDPGYVKGLLELPPAKQRAWIWGDWDAFDGQFFDFQKEKHVIEPQAAASALPPWAHRWISCDWGYAHACAVHGFGQGLDRRVHVYRELGFEGKVGSFEVGVEIAKAFFLDLSALPDHKMVMYLSHDAFNVVDQNSRRVDNIRAGIQTVLGPNSCFILEMSEDEKQLAKQDPDAAVRAMNQRRAQSTSEFSITIVKAAKNDYDAFNHVHELLRSYQVETKGEPEAEVIQYLRQNPNGELLVANYLNGFQTVDEVVPKILIHSCCTRLIETLPEMAGDENDLEKMKKVDGDDYVDSFLYGCSGHRAQQNQMPLSYYVAQQLQTCFENRQVDLTMAHLMNSKARADHEAMYGTPEPMRLGRFATRYTQGVN